jgi:hypothetical protein
MTKQQIDNFYSGFTEVELTELFKSFESDDYTERA